MIARAESGQARDNMIVFDAGDIVRGVCELYEPLAEQKGAGDPDRRAGARADQGQPRAPQPGHRESGRQCAQIRDARARHSAEIVLAARQEAERVLLTVADRGPGIAPAERARAVERFVRLPQNMSEPGSAWFKSRGRGRDASRRRVEAGRQRAGPAGRHRTAAARRRLNRALRGRTRTCAAEPRTCAAEPRTCAAEPRTCAAEPRTCAAEPRTRAAEPGARAAVESRHLTIWHAGRSCAMRSPAGADARGGETNAEPAKRAAKKVEPAPPLAGRIKTAPKLSAPDEAHARVAQWLGEIARGGAGKAIGNCSLRPRENSKLADLVAAIAKARRIVGTSFATTPTASWRCLNPSPKRNSRADCRSRPGRAQRDN